MSRIHVEPFKMAPKKAKSIEEGDKAFSWTDDELSLLLKVIIDFKAYQASNGKDWETVKRTYEDIIERFLERYPSKISDASQQVAEYPNDRDKSVSPRKGWSVRSRGLSLVSERRLIQEDAVAAEEL